MTLLANFSANEDFFQLLRTRLTNMDSANECFSGCAHSHKAANMNGRAIQGAYLFRLLHYWEEFQSLATKWHPNKAEMNRLCALVEDKCLNHFKNPAENTKKYIKNSALQ